jgi:hypothetical protein
MFVSIIVGVQCSDCVILAASGPVPTSLTTAAAISGGLEGLRAIGGQGVMGVSGTEELEREVTAALERYLADHGPGEVSEVAHTSGLQAALCQPMRLTAEMTRALEGLQGLGSRSGDFPIGEVLVALPSQGRPSLYRVDGECSVTRVHRGSSCAAIGPSKMAAESFLAFLQRLLWREGTPTRAAGQLAAYWTARHITDLEGGSVRSVQVVRLSEGEGKAADIVWYGERVIASLRRAVDAATDEVRAGVKRRVLVDFEIPDEQAAPAREESLRRRVPEVRVTLRPPEDKEKKLRW